MPTRNEILVTMVVLVVFLLLLIPPLKNAKERNKELRAEVQRQEEASTPAAFGRLHTIKHDDHLFVVLYSRRGVALMHHPDCEDTHD